MQVTVHLRDIMEGADEYNRAWEKVISIKHAPVRADPLRCHVNRTPSCSVCPLQVPRSSCAEVRDCRGILDDGLCAAWASQLPANKSVPAGLRSLCDAEHLASAFCRQGQQSRRT